MRDSIRLWLFITVTDDVLNLFNITYVNQGRIQLRLPINVWNKSPKRLKASHDVYHSTFQWEYIECIDSPPRHKQQAQLTFKPQEPPPYNSSDSKHCHPLSTTRFLQLVAITTPSQGSAYSQPPSSKTTPFCCLSIAPT